MGKREDLIGKYAQDLQTACGIAADKALLTKVTLGCGPAIYDAGTETIAPDTAEIAAIRRNFLIRKLGLKDGPELTEAIEAVIEAYGTAQQPKYRAVVYYLLVTHFRKQALYA